MYPPFNIAVKIVEGNNVIYLNTEQAIKIEIFVRSTSSTVPEVHITMSDGQIYKLRGTQAQAFIERVEGK